MPESCQTAETQLPWQAQPTTGNIAVELFGRFKIARTDPKLAAGWMLVVRHDGYRRMWQRRLWKNRAPFEDCPTDIYHALCRALGVFA